MSRVLIVVDASVDDTEELIAASSTTALMVSALKQAIATHPPLQEKDGEATVEVVTTLALGDSPACLPADVIWCLF